MAPVATDGATQQLAAVEVAAVQPFAAGALEVLSEIRYVQDCAALCWCGLAPVATDGVTQQLAALEVVACKWDSR